VFYIHLPLAVLSPEDMRVIHLDKPVRLIPLLAVSNRAHLVPSCCLVFKPRDWVVLAVCTH